MKILQITPYFPPAWSFGGPVRHVYELSKFLVTQGHKVIVFTTNKLSPSINTNKFHEIRDQIEIYRFPVYITYKGYWVTPCLNRYFFKIKPDIIHIHSFRNYQADIAYLCSKIKKIPYVLTTHGGIRTLEEYQPNFSLFRLIRNLYDRIIGKKMIQDAERLIAISKAETWHFKTLMAKKDKIVVIPNGVDPYIFQHSPRNADYFRNQFKINEKFILSVARLHSMKGFDFLIRAFDQIVKEVEDIKLVIIGKDFGFKTKVNELIHEYKLKNSVFLIDGISNALLIGAYSAASIYIQPSRSEPFGMAALEAASCGTPLIVTNVGGLKDIIPNNEFIVNFNDISKLKALCLILLKDTTRSKEISQNNRSFIMNFYNWNLIGGKIENIYKEIIKSKNFKV